MKILFIGGTGNISTDCAELLHKRGHEIIVVNRGNNPVPPLYRSIIADRKDPAAMKKALENIKVDVVINFLGYVVPDVEIDFKLFQGRIRQYIFISSATVYRIPHRILPMTENTPLGNPYSDYAQNKEKCEAWLMEKFRKEGFPVTIIRPSHTYSRIWIPNPIASAGYTFAARLEEGRPVYLHNNGENPWTLTATTDFAVGLAGLAGNEKAIGETFHITSDEALPWYKIYEEVAAAVGAEDPVIFKIPADFICEKFPELTGGLKGDKAEPAIFDNSKIKKFVPDFACKKSIRQGIRESVEWMRAHPGPRNHNPKVDYFCDKVVAAWLEAGNK
ncbi:MAG: NAD-dependent epimerase/dehydratase family protein [Kiritimatiellae bacterium]|nr:NAD-dependent epimerase/dehydratase family protein [Kiritimatiellia bacterium]